MYRFKYKNKIVFGKYCEKKEIFYNFDLDNEIIGDYGVLRKIDIHNCSEIMFVDVIEQAKLITVSDKPEGNNHYIVEQYSLLSNDSDDLLLMMPRINSSEFINDMSYITYYFDGDILTLEYVKMGFVCCKVSIGFLNKRSISMINKCNSIKVTEANMMNSNTYLIQLKIC
jgi:hypothetical protein